MELRKFEKESKLDYVKRIVTGKLIDKTIDADYTELAELVFGKPYASDVARRMFYGARNIIELMEAEDYRNISELDILKEMEEKKLEIQKERYKLQATKLEYNKNLRQESRFELFYDNVRQAKERLPLPVFEPIQGEGASEGEYVLAIADIHYGATFKSTNNEYSRDIAKERLELLAGKVEEYCKKNNVRKLTILELGDSIQGMLRISDTVINDIPVVESVIEVSRLLASFLNKISSYVEEVVYRPTMASNHTQARFLGTKASEMPYEDFQKIICNYIHDLLLDNKRINVVLPEKDYNCFNLNGQNILAMHGHQVKNIKNVVKNYSQLHRTFYDIVFMGHFHGGQQFSIGEGNGNTEVHIVPSFVGSCPYADSLAIGSKAMSRLYKIEENVGVVETQTFVLN